jgi:geranylgeranyl pyrophosphate synthase
MPLVKDTHPSDIKQVPQNQTVRGLIRQSAVERAASFPPLRSPRREELERHGMELLTEAALPRLFLGFAMVEINNAFWRERFAVVPFERRLLLLPHCIRDPSVCEGRYDAAGLHCDGCGTCGISILKQKAEELKYSVVVAEGASTVIARILEGSVDALLGVACLDSLDKSFGRISELGIPNMAVPLLKDGCVSTTSENDRILALMEIREKRSLFPAVPTRLPLFVETARIFEDRSLDRLLAPCRAPAQAGLNPLDPMKATDSIALDWLKRGGKRLRPFITLAAYLAARHERMDFESDTDFDQWLPSSVKSLAVAVEILHKASLVHDDIEDDDQFRYGRPTLSRDYGQATAINIGDYLVGLGYHLVAVQKDALGDACVTDLLEHFSRAHLELSRGQGAELLHHRKVDSVLTPLDVLAMYRLKTSPAFEAAIYTGLRAAGSPVEDRLLKPFCLYLGEGYQILNDLEDWQSGPGRETSLGRDALAGHPTILRAFALEAGYGMELSELLGSERVAKEPAVAVAGIRDLYTLVGVFDRAEALLNQLHQRAMRLTVRMKPSALRELMSFLVRLVIPRKTVL